MPEAKSIRRNELAFGTRFAMLRCRIEVRDERGAPVATRRCLTIERNLRVPSDGGMCQIEACHFDTLTNRLL